MAARLECDVFALPMKIRFRGVERREGIVIQGSAGVGEFSPFLEYDDDESATWLAAAIEAADRRFPKPVRDHVHVNCTVPAVSPEQVVAIVTAPHGCRTAKVKVAERDQTLDDDIARVATVRAALGASGRVRVDANGGWTVKQAVDAINTLAEFDLEYVEQPTSTVEELREVRGLVDIPIAADESIRRAGDPMRVKQLEAADIAVLKVQPLGGVRACLELAERIQLPVVVSSGLESSIGIATGVALAAALPDLPYACGLATTSMLARDLVAEPLQPVDGRIAVRTVVPEPELLAGARPDRATERRWLDRLSRCERLLQEQRR